MVFCPNLSYLAGLVKIKFNYAGLYGSELKNSKMVL